MIPILSIITPIYNGSSHIEKYFKEIDKIKDNRVEFILINDGSTDNTHQMIRDRLKMSDVKNLYIQQENMGAARARFNGITRASGEYIALLDCDDEFGPGALESALDKITNGSPNIDCVLFDLKFRNVNGVSDFSYSIKDWPVNGRVAFAETIDKWGLHGFGIFRKTVYLAAYSALSKLTPSSQNQVNDDELITRLAFFNSNLVDICNGTYLYNIETPSTTRGYNKNAHRMLNTSINLIKFIAGEVESQALIDKAYQNLLNHTLAVHRVYILNILHIENKEKWQASIGSAVLKLKESSHLFVLPKNVGEILKILIKKIQWKVLTIVYGRLRM